jgi:hypothetical protein
MFLYYVCNIQYHTTYLHARSNNHGSNSWHCHALPLGLGPRNSPLLTKERRAWDTEWTGGVLQASTSYVQNGIRVFLKFRFRDTFCRKIWRVPHLLPQVHTQTGWIPIVDLHHSQASVCPCKPCSAYTFWTRNRCCICDLHTSLLQCSMFVDIHSLQRC